jgi:hypothetical protein
MSLHLVQYFTSTALERMAAAIEHAAQVECWQELARRLTADRGKVANVA